RGGGRTVFRSPQRSWLVGPLVRQVFQSRVAWRSLPSPRKLDHWLWSFTLLRYGPPGGAMTTQPHTEEQIIAVLKDAHAGIGVQELCRKHGISDVSSGMNV